MSRDACRFLGIKGLDLLTPSVVVISIQECVECKVHVPILNPPNLSRASIILDKANMSCSLNS